MNDVERRVWEALKKIRDSELREDVVEAGLVRNVREENEVVWIDFVLNALFSTF